jgi:hypothetical protein
MNELDDFVLILAGGLGINRAERFGRILNGQANGVERGAHFLEPVSARYPGARKEKCHGPSIRLVQVILSSPIPFSEQGV